MELYFDKTTNLLFRKGVFSNLTRYNAYNIGRQCGWLSVNDIREKENMQPIEGGDVYLSPLNMTGATE